MDWMETLVLIVHVVISIALVGLVLIQHGKGADAGAAFGSGASQTVFGSQGSVGFLTRATSALAILFFVTSFSLAVFAKHRSESFMQEQGINVPAVIESQGESPKADGEVSTLKNAEDKVLKDLKKDLSPELE